MKSNVRLTPDDHFQETRLIELTVDEPYEPGDICLVQPSNSDENVDEFFAVFPQFQRNRIIRLESNDPDNFPLPPSWLFRRPGETMERFVRHVFDLQSVPKRYFFRLLAHFSSDETEREKCEEFDSAEGQQDLFDYCNRPRRSALEVLADFRFSAPNIPFEFLFDMFGTIRPRSFSIASSNRTNPDSLELLVAAVKFKSALVKPRLGLCSNFLARLEPNRGGIPIWIKKGTFKFPESGSLAMVGPGTGIAPFRAYLQDQLMTDGDGKSRRFLLFFGCRSQKSDFYFEAEWKKLEERNSAFKLISAFSRDQADKVYVQHLMLKEEFRLRKIIWEEKGGFFVAGNSKQMPDQVRDALKRVLAETAGLEGAKGEEFVLRMENDGRYQTETWS